MLHESHGIRKYATKRSQMPVRFISLVVRGEVIAAYVVICGY